MNHRINRLLRLMSKHSLLLAWAILVVAFVISRYPFFAYFPIPGCYVSDAFEYFKVAFEMKNGATPLFEFRTPGYPVFIYLVSLFSEKIIALVIVQNLISLASSLFLIFAVNRIYKWLKYPVCISLLFFLLGNNSLEADSSVVTNSLFSSCLLLIIGLLLLALHRDKYWIPLSILIGFIILIRPSGLFIVPIVGLTVIFVLRSKKYSRYAALKLVAPLALILLSLSYYNFKTLKIFAVSPFGGLALAGATITMIDTSASYSACENEAIARLQGTVADADKETVRSSMNPYDLHPVFFYNHYQVFTLYKDLIKKCAYANFIEALPAVKKIATDAVKNNPGYYAKFVLTGVYHFITTGNLQEHQLFYYSEVQRRYEDVYLEAKPKQNQYFATYVPDLIPEDLKQFAYREFYAPTADPVGLQQRNLAMKSNFLFKMFDIYSLKFNRVVLRNWIWPIALTLLFLYSGLKLLLSRFTNREAFIVFVVCCFHFCSAMLICLVEPSFYIYTYMTEFTYFLAPALSPILFVNVNSRVA